MSDETLEDKTGVLSLMDTTEDLAEYKKLQWEGSFNDYLQMVQENPAITRNAFQRLYDMVLSYGVREYDDAKKEIIHYNFFDDPTTGGKEAIYGLDIPLMKMMNVFKAAAKGYGPEKRILLLHGPVGSSKSTIVRLLKRGTERYSRTEEGALYTFEWTGLKEAGIDDDDVMPCPMHEDPLNLVPEKRRKEVAEKLSKEEFTIDIDQFLCPYCNLIYEELAKKYDGNQPEILKHVRVKRFTILERSRRGIGTFQPKDEKNQDSTELTGDINYRKIAEYGDEFDPRAFNFKGEFEIANRGLMEFIEVLKLDVAFLYDLLGATQDHDIKPKGFAQTSIDEAIIGHTNEAEFKKLQSNEFMEALQDRTIKIDIPYITKTEEEVKIYERAYRSQPGMHIAPHAREMAALWVVLTRLWEPKKLELTVLQKAKLYDGKHIHGFNEDHIKELRKEAPREGLEGISPRYIQDIISNSMVTEKASECLAPFLLLNELEAGLKNHSSIKTERERKRYGELIAIVKQEFEDTVKGEVQRAISADQEALAKVCANYIDQIKAYTQKEKVKNKYTGENEAPDERLMRSIEEKIDIPEVRKDVFRTELMTHIGGLAHEGQSFDYQTDERLRKAIELKLFEDQKDSIKLTSLVSAVIDKETQEKIDVVKQRLIDKMGYCEICATDVLNFVASIFARGDASEES
ncbi:serine protein kinase [Candidatus Woesearchaeota archaeon]|nr:serine protein kinase [Candidatus Woesearchaeota archaeon]